MSILHTSYMDIPMLINVFLKAIQNNSKSLETTVFNKIKLNKLHLIGFKIN